MAQYRGRTLRVLWNDGERDVWCKALVWDVHGADEPAPLLTLFYEGTAEHPAHVSYSRQHADFLRDLNQEVDVAWELLDEDGEEVLRVLLFVDDLCVLNARTAAGRALKVELKKNIEKLYEYSVDDAENMVSWVLTYADAGRLTAGHRCRRCGWRADLV